MYIREAEAVREGFGEVCPALPETLLRFGTRSGFVLNVMHPSSEN
jgi:hypothetical protein